MMKALGMVLAHVVEETNSVIIRECEQSETQQLNNPWDFSVEAGSVNILLILGKVKGSKRKEIEHRQQAEEVRFGCLLSDHIHFSD